ncbi:MAG TPA: 16S rRNA processing protein RimM [Deltaproteobacteria bacterium]|nr:16S rRNA processing protein RimM [Deltaproteobacteria bacterium]HCP45944.1 16S rRNA processing protein RimM [Deltaproteobacteria bacterium]
MVPKRPRRPSPTHRATSPKRRSSSFPIRSGLDLLIPAIGYDEAPESGLVRVGRLGRHWGVRGGITVRLDNPNSEMAWAGDVIWLAGEACPTTAVEVAGWAHKGGKVVVTFAGISAPEQVRSLTGLNLLVPADQLGTTDEDEHFVNELLGMQVEDANRGPLGSMVHVFAAGDTDVWVVRNEQGAEVMIPAVHRFVLEVDRTARLIRVDYPEPE